MTIKKPRKDHKIVPIEKKEIEKEAKKFIGKVNNEDQEALNSPSAKRNKLNMTIRFNNYEKSQLDKLKDKKGLTRIGVIRLAISDLIEKELG